MNRRMMFQRIIKKLLGRHGDVKSFEHEVQASGGMVSRSDAGMHTVDVRKIVGSVGRAMTLRSDFFYKRGEAMTARFHRVGQAMQTGKALPPLELYKVRREQEEKGSPPVSEYYVVDGHHRVAMARKLGQDFHDAHVVEYRLAGTQQAYEEHVAPHTADGETAKPEQAGELG